MNFYSKNGITVHSILDFSLRAIFRKKPLRCNLYLKPLSCQNSRFKSVHNIEKKFNDVEHFFIYEQIHHFLLVEYKQHTNPSSQRLSPPITPNKQRSLLSVHPAMGNAVPQISSSPTIIVNNTCHLLFISFHPLL